MRVSFYKKSQWDKHEIFDFIKFHCELFFECFVKFYEIPLPTKWDPNSDEAINLFGLFLDFLILKFSKKKVNIVLSIVQKLDSDKYKSLSKKFEQLYILGCKDKKQVSRLFELNSAFKHILDNYKSIFKGHSQFRKIQKVVDKYFKY